MIDRNWDDIEEIYNACPTSELCATVYVKDIEWFNTQINVSCKALGSYGDPYDMDLIIFCQNLKERDRVKWDMRLKSILCVRGEYSISGYGITMMSPIYKRIERIYSWSVISDVFDV